jgi:hypothetical protein
MIKAFCAELVTGATYETVAAALGINRDTITNWIARGSSARSGIYADFFREVEAAKAKSVQRLLAHAHRRVRPKKEGGVDADPLPLLAVIDRRYQPSVRVQVANELSAFLDAAEREFSPEIYERILRLAAQETGPGSVASTTSRAAGAHAGDGEAVRARGSESDADDVPRARG